MNNFPHNGEFYDNRVTIKLNPSEDSKDWWSMLSEDERIDMMIKHNPDILKRSALGRWSAYRYCCENPQPLFEKEFPELLIE